MLLGREQPDVAARYFRFQPDQSNDIMRRMNTVGSFITLEGIDGTGKSTQARLLNNALQTAGIPCVLTREPNGNVPDGIESLSPAHQAWIFYSDRQTHVGVMLRGF